MLLLDYARKELGMPVKGLQMGRHIGWTLDNDKAKALAEHGARVVYFRAHEKEDSGWEVSFAVGEECERIIAPH